VLSPLQSVRQGIILTLGLAATWAADPVPDFHLVDVNPNSARAQNMVSPRDYRLQISGYYFGDAG
jgi:hypothetical protein